MRGGDDGRDDGEDGCGDGEDGCGDVMPATFAAVREQRQARRTGPVGPSECPDISLTRLRADD
ncbi:hypothetical protein GCM10018791_03630 [Streptomyces zaomyceticus]|nr:hypothetical protein GCM10018791_03630 [Streptomyces zaomyceticus]